MKVGDLVIMPGSMEPITGIVLNTKKEGYVRGRIRSDRVKVFWVEDGEASWEPIKWLEVVSESR